MAAWDEASDNEDLDGDSDEDEDEDIDEVREGAEEDYFHDSTSTNDDTSSM